MSTSISPHQLTYGRSLRRPLEAQIDSATERDEGSHAKRLDDLTEKREQLEAIAREENTRAREKAKELYDRRSHTRARPHPAIG